MSPFKDVWGSRIIFTGPNKVFTQANKEQVRDLNHTVYAFDTREKMIENNNNLHKLNLSWRNWWRNLDFLKKILLMITEITFAQFTKLEYQLLE